MAARNPTSFTTFWDEEALQSGKRIVETVPDLIVTGMEEIFDSAELVISDVFKTIRTDEVGASWTAAMELFRYHLEAIDYCDEDGVAGAGRVSCAARVWCDATSADGSIRFQSLVNGGSVTQTFTNTSPAWVAPAGSLGVETDGTQEDIQFDLRLDSGYTYAYCNAICVWAAHK